MIPGGFMRLTPRLPDDRRFPWQVDLRLIVLALVVIESVRYYDSHGRLVRDHLTKPAELAVLASVEFTNEPQ